MKYALSALAGLVLGAIGMWLFTGPGEADLRQRANEYLTRVSELEGTVEDLTGQLEQSRRNATGIASDLEREASENRRLGEQVKEFGRQLGVLRRSFDNAERSIGGIEEIIRAVQKRGSLGAN